MVVLGELEGLTKSKEMVDRPEHAAMLRENSKAALTWIREKPANVKCVTTKGNCYVFAGVMQRLFMLKCRILEQQKIKKL